MDLLHHLLTAVAAGADPGPFALLRREGSDHLDVFGGGLQVVATLADIPLPPGPAGPRTLALVPFRQAAERGFTVVDDGTPLECLRIDRHERVPLPAALDALRRLDPPDTPDAPLTTGPGRFDVSDDEYAETVAAALREEIGRGEGANFVIHRAYTAFVAGPPLAAGLAALRRLLVGERGAYWTFLVHTGTRILVGATPERHVSVDAGLVMMNPISGTHRHPASGPDRAALLRFLADRKEIEELYMVLDEELKMMARVADQGGQILGPYLKEMSHLVHTEYLLAGHGSLDVREVLRETMFAPTVTGSPLENAFRVIARREGRGRRYYAGVLALLGHDEAGRQTLDAPILIRTAEISPAGELRVAVGATLVRHSTPAGEVAETHTKAAGVLTALGQPSSFATSPTSSTSSASLPRPALPQPSVPSLRSPALLPGSAPAPSVFASSTSGPSVSGSPGSHAQPAFVRSGGQVVKAPPSTRTALSEADADAEAAGPEAARPDRAGPGEGLLAAAHPYPVPPEVADPEIAAALAARNDHLARFWLERRTPGASTVPALAGRSVLILDGEDTFTGMLAHQLRAFGLDVTVRLWNEIGEVGEGLGSAAAGLDLAAFDLVVPGPGPGDPTSLTDPKMAVLRRAITGLLRQRRPMLAVCLGHQLLAGLLGLRLHRRGEPYQGLARTIDLFGRRRRVGFYSTFTAVADTDEIATPYGPVRLALDRDESDADALAVTTVARGGARADSTSRADSTGGSGTNGGDTAGRDAAGRGGAAHGLRAVHALRGPTFAGLQFHPESVLSEDGMAVLHDLLTDLVPAAR